MAQLPEPATVKGHAEEQRPQLTPALSGTELERWYWLSTELASLARTLGISPGGTKQQLTARLVAALDGRPPPDPPLRPGSKKPGSIKPGTSGRQLVGELSLDSVIPPGQRCSQELRRFFTDALGPSFRFDAPMREFIANGHGRTLREAADHWRATRDRPRGEIAPQFELNRFVRGWHAAHPSGTRAEALAAWRLHRSLPVDARTSPDVTP